MEKAVFIDLNIALTVPPQVMFFIFLIHLAVETKIKIALNAAEEVLSGDLLFFTGARATSIRIHIASLDCNVTQLMVFITPYLCLSATVS